MCNFVLKWQNKDLHPPFNLSLHGLTDDVPDGVGGIALHLRCGVGIGAEGEACIVVPQCTGQRLDVHAVLEGQRGEGVSEVVEAYVLRADSLQYLFVGVTEGVRVKHGAGFRRYEQVRAVGMLAVFLHWCCHCGDNNKHPESYPPTRTACHLRFAAHAT